MLQMVSSCDLTPGVESTFETTDDSLSGTTYVYRFEEGDVSEAGFSTRCLNGTRDTLTAVISNMPTGDLQYLDAPYRFRVTNTSNKKK